MQVWAGLWSINNAMSKQFYLVMSTETLCRQCVSPYIHTYISKVCVYILICHRAVTYVIISQVLKLHVWYVMILLKNLVTYYHMCILQGNMFIDVRILHKIQYVHCRYMYPSTDFNELDVFIHVCYYNARWFSLPVERKLLCVSCCLHDTVWCTFGIQLSSFWNSANQKNIML